MLGINALFRSVISSLSCSNRHESFATTALIRLWWCWRPAVGTVLDRCEARADVWEVVNEAIVTSRQHRPSKFNPLEPIILTLPSLLSITETTASPICCAARSLPPTELDNAPESSGDLSQQAADLQGRSLV